MGAFRCLSLCFVGALSIFSGLAGVADDKLQLDQELLLLIGEAQTSVTRASRLARAVDRCCEGVPKAVKGLARLGSSGALSRNVERDLERWVKTQFWRTLLPPIFKFDILHRDPDGDGAIEGVQSVLLPHEVFSFLHAGAKELFQYLMYDTAVHIVARIMKPEYDVACYEYLLLKYLHSMLLMHCFHTISYENHVWRLRHRICWSFGRILLPQSGPNCIPVCRPNRIHLSGCNLQ